MPLDAKNQKLLSTALKDLNPATRQFFQKLLPQLAEQSTWFKKVLERMIFEGWRFVIGPEKGAFATSYPTEKTLALIDFTSLNPAIPQQVLTTSLSFYIRHELTHSRDYIFGTQAEYEHTIEIANLLFNVIHCISNYNLINHTALSQFAPMIYSNNVTQGNVKLTLIAQPHLQTIVAKLRSQGSSADSEGSYILNLYTLYKSFNQFISIVTYDVALVLEKFYDTTQKINFKKSIGSKKLDLWQSLSLPQRQILDALFLVGRRVKENIRQEPVCFPRFSDCLSLFKEDCLLQLLECYSDLPEGKAFYYKVQAMLEIHASLNEHTEGDLFQVEDFLNLCPAPEEMPRIKYSPSESLSNSASLKVSGASFAQGAEPNRFAIDIQLAGRAAFYAVFYGFIDEATQYYFIKPGVKNASLIKLSINIGMVISVGYLEFNLAEKNQSSLVGQLVLPITLTMVQQLLQTFINLIPSTQIKSAINRTMSAALVTSQLIIGGAAQTVVNLSAGIVGGLAGAQLFKWMNFVASPSEVTNNNVFKTI